MRVDVPIHAGTTLKLKTLAHIIETAGMTVDEFTALLRGNP